MSRQQLKESWTIIKQDGVILASCEPILASFFHATLLKHDNLGNALSYILANKLATPITPAIVVREIIQDAYKNDKQVIAYAARDLKAIVQRDPAVDKLFNPVIIFKGLSCFTGLSYQPLVMESGSHDISNLSAKPNICLFWG